jgi:hypothetical protein
MVQSMGDFINISSIYLNNNNTKLCGIYGSSYLVMFIIWRWHIDIKYTEISNGNLGQRHVV